MKYVFKKNEQLNDLFFLYRREILQEFVQIISSF